MSRFSKIPVNIPEAVKVEISGNLIKVTGAKGTLERNFPKILDVKKEGENVLITSKEKEATKFGKAITGTTKAHIANMVKGVSTGWDKKLEIIGTGYRAEVRDGNLVLTVGFSHPVIINKREGINFTVEKNIIKVEGIDRETVGQIAAQIKMARPPDPYKGKGIRYQGQILKLKPGKQAAKAGGAA